MKTKQLIQKINEEISELQLFFSSEKQWDKEKIKVDVVNFHLETMRKKINKISGVK